jgi:hypothetical protein
MAIPTVMAPSNKPRIHGTRRSSIMTNLHGVELHRERFNRVTTQSCDTSGRMRRASLTGTAQRVIQAKSSQFRRLPAPVAQRFGSKIPAKELPPALTWTQ